ncbi:hypothetical protein ACHAWF_001550, partial [Thalassiosira exigua]
DVLFGRGSTISAHPGNKQLRSVTQARKPAFLAAKKPEKRNIARRIVDEIRNLDPPGRFLIEGPTRDDRRHGYNDITGKLWLPVDTEKAVNKVMQRLREKERGPDDDDGSERVPSVPNASLPSAARGTSMDSRKPQPPSNEHPHQSNAAEDRDQKGPHGKNDEPANPTSTSNDQQRGKSIEQDVQPNIKSLFGCPNDSSTLFPVVNPNHNVNNQRGDGQQAGKQETPQHPRQANGTKNCDQPTDTSFGSNGKSIEQDVQTNTESLFGCHTDRIIHPNHHLINQRRDGRHDGKQEVNKFHSSIDRPETFDATSRANWGERTRTSSFRASRAFGTTD